ncbi:4754_t:CDS:2, partial [Acaulospora colombiana]
MGAPMSATSDQIVLPNSVVDDQTGVCTNIYHASLWDGWIEIRDIVCCHVTAFPTQAGLSLSNDHMTHIWPDKMEVFVGYSILNENYPEPHVLFLPTPGIPDNHSKFIDLINILNWLNNGKP